MMPRKTFLKTVFTATDGGKSEITQQAAISFLEQANDKGKC